MTDAVIQHIATIIYPSLALNLGCVFLMDSINIAPRNIVTGVHLRKAYMLLKSPVTSAYTQGITIDNPIINIIVPSIFKIDL